MRRHGIDDILVGIFYYFPGKERRFQYDRLKLHEFFYEKQFVYPILKEIRFRKKQFSESKELD